MLIWFLIYLMIGILIMTGMNDEGPCLDIRDWASWFIVNTAAGVMWLPLFLLQTALFCWDMRAAYRHYKKMRGED